MPFVSGKLNWLRASVDDFLGPFDWVTLICFATCHRHSRNASVRAKSLLKVRSRKASMPDVLSNTVEGAERLVYELLLLQKVIVEFIWAAVWLGLSANDLNGFLHFFKDFEDVFWIGFCINNRTNIPNTGLEVDLFLNHLNLVANLIYLVFKLVYLRLVQWKLGCTFL